MSFNKGYKCPNCGPVEDSKKKTVKKVQYDICKICEAVVTPWERPLNERAGRCRTCAGGSFTLALHKRKLLRCCKTCKEVVNPDTNEILRKGVLTNE